jgi:multiple sugar transport system substrate-binding protein
MRLWTLAPRRLARLALGLAIVLSIVCSSSLGAHATGLIAAPVSLKYLTWDPPNVTNNYTQPCAKKLPNIHVQVEQSPRTGYEVKVQTEFAAGTAPDFFQSPENTTLEWGRKGLLLDQAPYRKAMHLPYGGNLLAAAQYRNGNKLFGVDALISTMDITFNKQVFQDARVAFPPADAAHAWTWAQFVAVARQLTVDRQGRHPGEGNFDARHIQRYGVSLDGGAWYAPVIALVRSNGGDVFDSTYKHFTLNQPAAAEAIQAMADLALKDHVMPTPTQQSSGAGSISLASGRVAMLITGTWQVDFYQHPTRQFPLGLGVLPKFKQFKDVAFAPPWVVWAKTPNPGAAMQMIACYSEQYSSGLLAKQGLGVPTDKSLLTGAGFERWGVNADHPSTYRSAIVDTLLHYSDGLPVLYMTKFSSTWDNIIQPAIDQVMTGSKSARDALRAITPQVDAVLAQP